MGLHNYPSVFTLGHKAIRDLLDGIVVVQEKIDGSQFSFGSVDGLLQCRSKRTIIDVDAPDKLFAAAVTTVKKLFDDHRLVSGWTYRGEVLSKPKHNTLAYSRVPIGNVILFDVDTGMENYVLPAQLACISMDLELEVVSTLFVGQLESLAQLSAFLERDSRLGGVKVEGVVIKNYNRFGVDKKCLMGKLVSAEFQEKHQRDWHERNPAGTDIVEEIGACLAVEARWQKAVQHVREAGNLVDGPQDIGLLIRAVHEDIEKEETDWIKVRLYEHVSKKIKGRATNGLPEWYKRRLAEQGFSAASLPGAGIPETM